MSALDSRGLRYVPGTVTVQRAAGGIVLCLAGEVDAAVVWAFQAEHGPPAPVDAIDAGAVTFIGSHGVELMVDWARVSAAAGRTAVLRRSTRWVDRVLRLTGLEGELSRPTPLRVVGPAEAKAAPPD